MSSRNLISTQELAEQTGQLSAYDVVRRLRPVWLRTRGGSGAGAGIQVYINNVHAGGLDMLNRPLDGIREIRYFSAGDATTKWGTGVSDGVIELITR